MGLNPILSFDYETFRRLYEKQEDWIVLLIGADLMVSEMGWNCGACGFETCARFNQYVKKHGGMGTSWAGPSCNWKALDFGIASDWACAAAGQSKVSNRIVGSLGSSAQLLGYLPECSAIMALPMGPLRDLVYFSREELHGAITYEEHKDALLRSIPTHFSGYPEQWRQIVKRKDRWWEDPDLLVWEKGPGADEHLKKVRQEVEQLVEKYRPDIQKMYKGK